MRLLITFALAWMPLHFASVAVCAEEAKVVQKPEIRTMQELLEIATQREQEIRKTVRDYSCLIVKRERINGKLQENRFIEAKVRTAGVRDGRKVPLGVRLVFRAPSDVAGRTLVFVDGENDGKMVVRRGGDRLGNVTVKVDPNSEIARNETTMHIAHLGIDSMVSEIIAHIRKDIQADPSGSNTELTIRRNAKINGRPCTAVEIIHPQRERGLAYHRAEFFVDNEFHLPVRVAAYDWPKSAGEEPELLGEFTYTKVKINIGLSDAEFDPEFLRTASRK